MPDARDTEPWGLSFCRPCWPAGRDIVYIWHVVGARSERRRGARVGCGSAVCWSVSVTPSQKSRFALCASHAAAQSNGRRVGKTLHTSNKTTLDAPSANIKLEKRRSPRRSAHSPHGNTQAKQTRPLPFPTCLNCQTSDTDTFWSLVIGSQCKFRACLVVCVTDLTIGAPCVWTEGRC